MLKHLLEIFFLGGGAVLDIHKHHKHQCCFPSPGALFTCTRTMAAKKLRAPVIRSLCVAPTGYSTQITGQPKHVVRSSVRTYLNPPHLCGLGILGCYVAQDDISSIGLYTYVSLTSSKASPAHNIRRAMRIARCCPEPSPVDKVIP